MEDKAKEVAPGGVNADEILKKAAAFGEVANVKPLPIGSDVDIAMHVAAGLRSGFNNKIVYYEGEFLFYNGKCWEALKEPDLRRLIHKHDGVPYGLSGKNCNPPG